MNVSNISNNKNLCCGCNACEFVCPVSAIRMTQDEIGQLYPLVDEDKCVDCSLCLKVCCENNSVPQRTPIKVYAASYKKTQVSKRSSSGGIFPAIAEDTFKAGGIVYGTHLDHAFKASVIGVDTPGDLAKLQGSKYVRSNMGDIYGELEEQLKNGRMVLFSGVPCQVAAVKQYLRKDYSNLLTVDIVCHGTPSQKMFLDYLKFVQKKRNIQIDKFIFRDKDVVQDVTGKVVYKQDYLGKVVYKQDHLRAYQSSYYKLFLNCSTFRESCYYCKFAAPERVGDITLCDYWGVDEEDPDFIQEVRQNNLVGISGVMVNTEAGMNCIARIEEQLLKKSTTYEKVRKNNPQLNHPSHITTEHSEVMELYCKYGYKAVDDYYYKKYRTKIMASTVGQLLPSGVKKKMVKMKRKIKK